MKNHKQLVVSTAALALIGLLFALPGVALAVSTSFEDVPVGTAASDISLSGVEFIESLAPGSWVVEDSPGTYTLLSGHILSNYHGGCGSTLSMRFDELQSEINFMYVSDRSRTPGTPDVVLYLFTGGNPTPGIGTRVYTGDFYGTDLGSGLWEGAVRLRIEYDFVVLFSPSGCLAIDDLKTSGIWPLDPHAPGPDMIPIPDTARGGCITEDTPVYWAPRLDAPTNIVLTAGKTVWALGPDASGEFFKIAFAGHYLWVPSIAIGPNLDSLWQGAPLPMEPVD
ncbi:MAG: hypothetical protein HY866_17050 [Chloroflexi bacterium]|nr:hypothetical protein [Chloroflexota bacterium]